MGISTRNVLCHPAHAKSHRVKNSVRLSIQRFDLPTIVKRIVKHLLCETKI